MNHGSIFAIRIWDGAFAIIFDVDSLQLQTILTEHFVGQGFSAQPDPTLDVDLLLVRDGERLGLLLCAEREEGMAFLGAFEAAMQRAVDARRAQPEGLGLGLGLAFGSTVAGKHTSYRRALKKYSSSIVFQDLDLSLYLVQGQDQVLALSPEEVNPFLRGLDRWIAEQTPGH